MNTLSPLSPPRAADPPSEAAPPRAAARASSGVPAPASPGLPNPSQRLDPALGLVVLVLEFRDQTGRTATLPTERELAAYRTARGRPDPTAPPAQVGAAQAGTAKIGSAPVGASQAATPAGPASGEG